MTIEELCEKYFPIGSDLFKVESTGAHAFRTGPHYGDAADISVLVDDGDPVSSKYWTSIIACVSAMHWANQEREWGDKGDAIFNMGEEIPPEKVEAMNKAFDEANKALVAQKAWSELAKGV